MFDGLIEVETAFVVRTAFPGVLLGPIPCTARPVEWPPAWSIHAAWPVRAHSFARLVAVLKKLLHAFDQLALNLLGQTGFFFVVLALIIIFSVEIFDIAVPLGVLLPIELSRIRRFLSGQPTGHGDRRSHHAHGPCA
jgi:hypothetical protein